MQTHHDTIVDYFVEHEYLLHNIKYLHYGAKFLLWMRQHDCNLTELMNAINEASQMKIAQHNLGVELDLV